jgi:hypothetical protein
MAKNFTAFNPANGGVGWAGNVWGSNLLAAPVKAAFPSLFFDIDYVLDEGAEGLIEFGELFIYAAPNWDGVLDSNDELPMPLEISPIIVIKNITDRDIKVRMYYSDFSVTPSTVNSSGKALNLQDILELHSFEVGNYRFNNDGYREPGRTYIRLSGSSNESTIPVNGEGWFEYLVVSTPTYTYRDTPTSPWTYDNLSLFDGKTLHMTLHVMLVE